jgi:WD40 repeat protein
MQNRVRNAGRYFSVQILLLMENQEQVTKHALSPTITEYIEVKLPHELESNQYDVFISYSRSDIDFARALEKALEKFKPPAGLKVPHHRLNVFRDEGDLTGVDYFKSIEGYLNKSAKLIVVCSPNARKSEYVNDEIKRFADAKGAENIISVLYEGIPNNQAKPDQEQAMAFPDALCQALEMPLATPYLNFDTRSDNIRKGKYENSWYTLLADTYDVSREEIEQRERHKRRRQLTVWSAVLGATTLAFAFLAAVAWWQKLEAERQKTEAIKQRNHAVARDLATQAQLVFAQQPWAMTRSVLLACESLRHAQTPAATAFAAIRFPLLRSEISRVSHIGPIQDVAISADGSRIATASADHITRIWDAANGSELTRLDHKGPILDVDFSYDGNRIAGARKYSAVAWIWDTKTGTQLQKFRHSRYIHSIAYSPNGHLVVTTADDFTTRVWDAENGKEITRLNHEEPVISAIFGPDSKRVATVCDDGAAQIWEVANGKELVRIIPHGKKVTAVAFNHVGHLLATAGTDKTVRVWDTKRWTEIMRINLGDIVTALVFSQDNKWLVTGSKEGIVKVFSTAKGEELAALKHADAVKNITFNKDNTRIITASLDGSVRLWNTVTWQELARLSSESSVYKVAVSQKGDRIVTAGKDKIARVWYLEAGVEQKPMVQAGGVTSIAFSPSTEKLATASSYNSIVIWDTANATELWSKTFDGSVNAIIFSSDGTLVAAASRDGTARIYDAFSGVEMKRFKQDGDVLSVVVSPDKQFVAAGTSYENIHLWDLASGNAILEFSLGGVNNVESIAFSHDSKRLLMGTDYSARILDIQTKNPLTQIDFAAPVSKAVFSHDERLVATGSVDRTIKIIDANSGVELTRMMHEDFIRDLAFSSDDTLLASASDDGTARIWDVKTGREIARLPHSDVVYSIAFSADNRSIATGSRDGSVRIFNWRSQDLIDSACMHLSRNFSRSEWREYLGDEPYRPTCPNLPVADD